MQFYKGDETEIKYDLASAEATGPINEDLNTFFDDAFKCFVLGDVIWESKRSPLANAIPQEIFREAYPEIYETFLEAGSFEGYISVFKKIFGDNAGIEFTVPAPGKLIIDIEANQIVISDIIARNIADNQYYFDEIIDYDGNTIAAQSIKGMESQYEVETMLFEMVPCGIFTDINLTVGA